MTGHSSFHLTFVIEIMSVIIQCTSISVSFGLADSPHTTMLINLRSPQISYRQFSLIHHCWNKKLLARPTLLKYMVWFCLDQITWHSNSYRIEYYLVSNPSGKYIEGVNFPTLIIIQPLRIRFVVRTVFYFSYGARPWASDL